MNYFYTWIRWLNNHDLGRNTLPYFQICMFKVIVKVLQVEHGFLHMLTTVSKHKRPWLSIFVHFHKYVKIFRLCYSSFIFCWLLPLCWHSVPTQRLFCWINLDYSVQNQIVETGKNEHIFFFMFWFSGSGGGWTLVKEMITCHFHN